MKIFASTLTYQLGKSLGIEAAAKEFSRQVASPRPYLAAALTIQRLGPIAGPTGEVIVYHGASTSLPKARSRAAHAFLESGADVWVMVDDDVLTDQATLERMIAIAGASRVAILPCLIRGTTEERHVLNCQFEGQLVQTVAGQDVRAVRQGGCGLMVVPRMALERVRETTLLFDDDDGQEKSAFFAQLIMRVDDGMGEDGSVRWLGEDLSFCQRLREANVEMYAPCGEGFSQHDGFRIQLRDCATAKE